MKSSDKKHFAYESSNSIVWEGEDLPCIKLCKGDTVSDVVYKLAIEICAIKKAYDLRDIDLKTVFVACLACPQPEKTLKNVLQLIINKIKSIDAVIAALGSTSSTAAEVSVTLASCFLPHVDSNGDNITKLPHADYTRLIASMVCTVVGKVNGALVRIDSLETSLAAVIVSVNALGSEVKITSCLATSTTPVTISAAVQLLNGNYCTMAKALGSPAKLLSAITNQPTSLKDKSQLGGTVGTMSAMLNEGNPWINTVSTVADSMNNLWMTVLDMRSALQLMQDNCCKITCDSVVVDFSIKLDDTRTLAKLFFASKTKLPVGFTDCATAGNVLTITDALGNIHTETINIKTYSTYTTVAGVTTEPFFSIDLSATSIDPTSNYTFTMDACMSNGTLTCQKCITKSVTYKDTCSFCEVVVTAGSSTTGSLIIGYTEKQNT